MMIRRDEVLARLSGRGVTKKFTLYLGIAILGSFLFLVWQFFLDPVERRFQRIVQKQAATQAGSLDVAVASPKKKALESYESAVSGKSIFQASAAEEPVQVAARATVPSNPFGAIGGDPAQSGEVMLVGILPGAVPQAILEDPKTQRTFYLSAGQSSGEITVESIQGDAVVASVNGQRKKFSI